MHLNDGKIMRVAVCENGYREKLETEMETETEALACDCKLYVRVES